MNDLGTETIDAEKLMAEINARPELWVNLLETMTMVTIDELNDNPPGEHANFQTLLAHALGGYTGQYDDQGNETAWLDIYTDTVSRHADDKPEGS